jgi:hypothetical protein
MRPSIAQSPIRQSSARPKIFSYVAPCSLRYNDLHIDDNKSTFSITLKYDSAASVYISLFLNVTETENTQCNLTEKFEIAQKGAFETHSLCMAGTGKEITKTIKFPFASICSLKVGVSPVFPECRRFKMVVRMEPQKNAHRFVNCFYFDFETVGGKWVPKLVKHKAEIKEQAYSLNEIYGIDVMNGNTQVTKDSIEQYCKICLDNMISIIVVPCRHMCLCLPCAQLYNTTGPDRKKKMKPECPVCKTHIQGFLNIQGNKLLHENK